jgi:hypothetical protein
MEPQAIRSGAGERHPSQADLESFMRGELSEQRAVLVVRHLLRGCARCAVITGRLWRFGDEGSQRVAPAQGRPANEVRVWQ